MSIVDYYTRPDGSQPAADWVNSQDKTVQSTIDGRILQLKRKGLALEGTKMLVHIRAVGKYEKYLPGLYELRHVGFGWRMGVYYDKRLDTFLLLNGWKKGQEKKGIRNARILAEEYISEE